MTTQGLSVRVWNGAGISRRNADGYINATAMCKANGKHLPHYMANVKTGEYIRALAGSVGIPTDLLVQPITTGINQFRGTWVHPRLAVDLARWISPAFAVWMDGWFLEAIGAASCPPPSPEARQPQAHAPADPPRPSAPSAPLPSRASLMTHEELRSTSGHLTALLSQRQRGDQIANDLIRAFAQHLLLSCDPLPPASQVFEGVHEWSVALRGRTGPEWERRWLLSQRIA